MNYINSFEQIGKDFKKIYGELCECVYLSMSELNTEKTVHITVDMVNGFVKEGALASKEVFAINNDVEIWMVYRDFMIL